MIVLAEAGLRAGHPPDAHLDEAFVRRFHVIVDFPMPSEADRQRIWKGLLPEKAKREAGWPELRGFRRDWDRLDWTG